MLHRNHIQGTVFWHICFARLITAFEIFCICYFAPFQTARNTFGSFYVSYQHSSVLQDFTRFTNVLAYKEKKTEKP